MEGPYPDYRCESCKGVPKPDEVTISAMIPLDIFEETSGQFPVMFLVNQFLMGSLPSAAVDVATKTFFSLSEKMV